MRGSIGLASIMRAESVYDTSLGQANIDLLSKLHGMEGLGNGWRGDVLEVVRRDGRQSAAWAVAFREARQSEAFANFYTKMIGRTTSRAELNAFEEKDGTVSVVLLHGNVTAILIRVPREQSNAVAEATSRAFH